MTTLQERWSWCKKCESLWYAGEAGKAGVCPAGGQHVTEASANYKIHSSSGTAQAPAEYKAQNNWRLCRKCLCFAHSTAPGRCAAGGPHDRTGSLDYAIAANVTCAGQQGGWTWCNKCQGLSFAAHKASSNCPAGGQHETKGSWQYSLDYSGFIKDAEEKEKTERERREREMRERIERETRERIERETRERIERETRERIEREERERIERIRREEEERKRREEEERKRREEEERRRREAEELERKMNSVPYLRQLVEEQKREIAQLKADLQNEKIARITAEVKLEKAGIKA